MKAILPPNRRDGCGWEWLAQFQVERVLLVTEGVGAHGTATVPTAWNDVSRHEISPATVRGLGNAPEQIMEVED